MANQPPIRLLNLVRKYFPQVDDRRAANILFNETGYPLTSDVEFLRCQLAVAASKPAEFLSEEQSLWGEL